MTYHVQFLLLVLAGWVNRQQQDVIDYLREENRVLRAGLRGKRLRLSDDDRRRLADHVFQHIETLQSLPNSGPVSTRMEIRLPSFSPMVVDAV